MHIFGIKRGVGLLLVLGLLPQAIAVQPPETPGLDNYDRRADAINHKLLKANGIGAPAQAAQPAPNLQVERDPWFGTPKWILAKDGFLTGPNGQPKDGIMRAAAAPPADPHYPVKAFLDRHADWLKHGSALLKSARIERDYVTKHNGLRTVVWQQEVDGIEVFGGRLVGHITDKGELVSLSNQLLPLAEKSLAASATQSALKERPNITAARALAVAAREAGEAMPLERDIAPGNVARAGQNARQSLLAPVVLGEAQLCLVWLPIAEDNFRLCWDAVFYGKTTRRLFRVLVDAGTGQPWLRHNLTKYAEPATYRVYTSDSPTTMSPGFTTPTSQQPPEVPRQLVTLAALSTNASPGGWLATNVFETRGNNVDAHLDRNQDNQPDLPRPTATNRVFDFPLDLTLSPTNFGAASVVNLFYWCNVMHDRLYDLGFTELSGNFQLDNFGRGGQGGDPVQADAQDGEGFNNANFSTPPRDGDSPRMQMYIFNGPDPDRDGSFDADVVLHEYTHGLSERLVGGGFGIIDTQSAGMAEGWSDFMAMAILSEPTDDQSGNYPFSGYVARKFGFALDENYYYGLRRYPYTTNLARNPLTFRDIDPNQASFHLGVPRNPAIGSSAAEEHNQGEVWCVMLWEIRVSLIGKYGFETGNRLAMQLVVDGMRGAPANPTFINARDAILMADRVNNSNANRAELWAAFAKRGMGAYATAPPGFTTSGVVEDFKLPEDFEVSPQTPVSMVGVEGGPFDPALVSFDLYNAGSQPLSWTASASGLLELSARSGTLASGTFTTVTCTLAAVAVELPSGNYTQTVTFVNLGTGSNLVRQVTVQVRQAKNFLVELFDSGDFDLQYSTLTFTPDGSADGYSVCWQAATNFPTDPTDGTQVTLGDDWYVPINFTNGTVAIWGERSNIFYISSNGQLAMRMGNTNYFQPELYIFYEQSRAAALYNDLNPSEGGVVSQKQLPDHVAVTWQNVPEFGIANSNNFQIELFTSGVIRMTWLKVDATTAKVGLSPGKGVPDGLIENDFSASPICGMSLAIQVQAGVEGQGLVTNAGCVMISNPAADPVEVALNSSDATKLVLPAAVIIPVGQTSAWFDATYPDNALREGTRSVRVSATATNYSPAQALVTIQDNDAATLSLQLAMVKEGTGLVADAGTVLINPPPDAAVLVRLSSANTNLVAIPSPAIAFVGAGQTSGVFNVQVGDNNTIEGLSGVRLTAEVAGWDPASAMMLVRDNEDTRLSLLLPDTVGETFGFMSNGGRVSVAGPLTFDLVVFLESSAPARLAVPSTVMIHAGQSAAYFDLTVIDDAFVNASNAVSISANASGFVSVARSVGMTDDEALPAPLLSQPLTGASNVALLPVLRWTSGIGELLANGDFETGDFSGWSNSASAGGGFVINDGTFVSAQGAGPFAAIEGGFEALSQQTSAGHRELWQALALPTQPGSLTLSWRHRIRNFADGFSAQHRFRVELRDATNGLLATLFTTQAGDPLVQEAVAQTASLDAWRGRSVRVVFVEDDQLGCLNVSVDSVSARFAPATPVAFEVYLGTTPQLTASNLVAVTTNNFLALSSPLASGTNYYWQVVARRGAETSSSPTGSFTTAAGDLPSVTLASPLNYAIIASPTNVVIAATATSPWGVTKVSYFVGATKIGETFSSPHQFIWPATTAGQYEIRAVAQDGAGQIAVSRVATLIVVQPGNRSLTLVPAGAEWKYLDNGSDQGTAWHTASFDDSAWKTGRAKFGYGIGGEATVVDYGPDPGNKFITTYFRTTFTNDAILESLTLRLLYDDGAVVWFNDQPMLVNLPPFPIISFNDRAMIDVSGAGQTNYSTYNMVTRVVGEGVNTLAVEVHQFASSSPDLAFDLALEGYGNYRPHVSLTAPTGTGILPTGQPVTVTASAFDRYGRVARVEFFADDQNIGEAVQAPYTMQWTNAAPGTHSLTAVATDDLGATNRTAPVQVIVGSPSLVAIAAENGFRLAWTAGAENFVLEAAITLPPVEWQSVTNTVVSTNGINTVVVPLDLGQRFFRLRQLP